MDNVWIGVVVPKRHARRAVTRNLLRRQIRNAMQRHVAALAGGMWLVRLRKPFALGGPTPIAAAASDALRRGARAELDAMLQRAGDR